MSYQILFTDLDGTLLNRRSELSEATKRAVGAALDRGKRIVINSGRSWLSLARFEQELGLDRPGCYGIAFNGAVVYETATQRFLFEQTMDNALGQDIIQALKDLGADIVVYAGRDLIVEQETPDILLYRDQSRLPLLVVDDFSEITGKVTKVLIKGSNADLRLIYEKTTPTLGARCSIFFSSPQLLEFSHPEVDKGRALAFLSEYLNIPLSKTIAVGDHWNDIGMLRTAGLGIAVANAEPEVKAAADRVMLESNDRDAVAKIITDML